MDHPEAVNGADYLGRYPNLVVMRTLSKAYGLAGLRIGYALAPENLIQPARQTAIPLAVSAPAQLAAEAALDHEAEIVEKIAEIRDQMARARGELADISSGLPLPWGNFVWLPTGRDTQLVASWFDDEAVVGRVFEGEGIRVSIAEPEGVDALLRVVRRVVSDLPHTLHPAPLG